MPALAERGHARLQVDVRRVGIDLGEQSPAETCLLQQVECLAGDRQIGEPAIGNQQRVGHAGGLAGVGDFGDTSGAEADGGRVRPVSGR